MSPTTDFSDSFLLTVHGVRSDNAGLAQLRNACQENLPGLLCDSYSYGRVLPFGDITPEISQFIFRSVREKLELVHLKHLSGKNRKLYVVAHSFGTLAVVRAMGMHVPGLRIEGLVLLGSVVPRNFLWDGFVGSGMLACAPLVVVRPFDMVVWRSQIVGGGPSGSRGFIPSGVNLAIETYKSGGHGAYASADGSEIVTMIRDGLGAVPLVTQDSWYQSIGWFRRRWLSVLRFD